MSCGKEHETPCGEVLHRVFEYLDGEMAELDCAKIKAHLEECTGCLNEYHRDELLKTIVRRSCACETAPEDLRSRILASITVQTVQIRYDT
ncbi:MAG: mycothiol system anti-sigma-R factor [Actinomycetota bacterium]|nr:mycothiol system anti-sigma-R factor [Actinomycetota bacterium]